jgi:hypothetical protein
MALDARNVPLKPTCPHLPAELWAQVLIHVDNDVDFWVNYRRVSRTLRTEATRTFAKSRLQRMDITWQYRIRAIANGVVSEQCGTLLADSMLSFSEHGTRAQFPL